MSLKNKIIVLTINNLLCIAIALATGFFMYGWGTLFKVVCYGISVIGFIGGTALFFLDKQALLKSCFILAACAFVVVFTVALISIFADLNNYPSDAEKMQKLTDIIRGTGKWGMLVYVLIQVLQVVILPLPAAVCYIPGSQIWGALPATLLASLGVIIGSVIAYSIGRFFGKKVVVWIAGKEVTDKYVSYIGSRGKIIFLMMQILPFFPDDILCMVAGLTSMSFPFFIITMIVVRPLIIAAYCYLGSGTIIPFSGWGIPVWIAIFAVCIALAILSLKYQDRFEKWLVSKFHKNKDKKEESSEEDNS